MVGTRPLFCAQTVIGVIEAFNHSIGHRVKALQGRDWVIGKKAGIWVEESYRVWKIDFIGSGYKLVVVFLSGSGKQNKKTSFCSPLAFALTFA